MRQFGGTGLGLTVRAWRASGMHARVQHVTLAVCDVRRMQICRRIARAMGGDLLAESEGLGKGSTLTFIIPLCTPPLGSSRSSEDGSCVVHVAAAAAVPPDDASSLDATATCAAGDENSASRRATTPAAPAAVGASFVPPPLKLALTTPSVLPVPEEPPARIANILVAEDDALSQAVMRKILTRLALRFTIVDNGVAAVEAYKQGAC